MRQCRSQRGFSLLETLIAMLLVGMSMTSLVLAFVATGRFGVLSRRQANAIALARSIAGQLSRAPYTDTRLVNNNTQNDASFADPNGLFALPTLPSGADAPDNTLPNSTLGSETYEVYVNVAPLMDPVNVTLEQGRQFAVIVRYRVGNEYRIGTTQNYTNVGTWRRAVVLGYRYNPANMGVGQLPL
jgi:prepilin-type N-terminal cleavage/methylation domain-containing protein